MMLRIIDVFSGTVRFVLVSSVHTPGIGIILGLVLFIFFLQPAILIAYVSLLLACCLCSKRRGLGLLYVALSLGCTFAIATFWYHRYETGLIQVSPSASAVLYWLSVYGAMLIWALPIAALVRHGGAIVAGGTTFVLALMGYTWFILFWFSPNLKHLRSLGHNVPLMPVLGVAFLFIFLSLTVLISPYLVGKLIWGIMDRLQQTENFSIRRGKKDRKMLKRFFRRDERKKQEREFIKDLIMELEKEKWVAEKYEVDLYNQPDWLRWHVPSDVIYIKGSDSLGHRVFTTQVGDFTVRLARHTNFSGGSADVASTNTYLLVWEEEKFISKFLGEQVEQLYDELNRKIEEFERMEMEKKMVEQNKQEEEKEENRRRSLDRLRRLL